MKYLFTILIISFLTVSCKSQSSSDSIFYELHKNVAHKVEKHLNGRLEQSNQIKFVADLSNLPDGKYLLSLIEYEGTDTKGFDLIFNQLVKKTNRFLRTDNYKIPLILSFDLLFADLGKTKMPDGRIASKRVVFNFDGYSITFDRNGIIYE